MQALALGRLHSCGISKYGLLQCWGGKQDESNTNSKVVNTEDIKVITNLKLSTRGIRFSGFKESSGVVDVRDITNVHTFSGVDLSNEDRDENKDEMLKQ